MDALYFPHLSLPGPAWTNPNLLYFDSISVIAPSRRDIGLFDGPTGRLIEHNLVRPIDPQRYRADPRSDAAIVGHILGLGSSQKRHAPLATIHLGKISGSPLMHDLIELGLLWKTSEWDWLEGPVWVIEYVMSVLAIRILMDADLALVTDHPSARGLVAGPIRRDVSRDKRRLQAVTTLLPVGPDVSVDHILRFRDDHRRELREFRMFVEALAFRSVDSGEDAESFSARLRSAEEVREYLVGKLEAVRSSAPPLAIALSVASVAAPAFEGSPYSLAASAMGLGYLLLQQQRARASERRMLKDKLVYAAIAADHFRPKRAAAVLRY